MAERQPPPAPPEAEPDPYAVLGVSPDAEDVVIRAAYRALLHKYTTPGRVPDDPVGDDARTRAVQGAYELLKDPEIRRAYDQHRRDQAQAVAEAASRAEPGPSEPLVLKPGGPGRRARSKPRRRSAAPLIVGVLLIAALAVGALVLGRRSLPSFNDVASSGNLVAQPQKPASLATAPARPLPCYVDGRPIGSLPLSDCAARNGVATGQLEVGLNGPPTKAAALTTTPPPGPVNSPTASAAVAPLPPERFPTAGAAGAQSPQVAPPVSPRPHRPGRRCSRPTLISPWRR